VDHVVSFLVGGTEEVFAVSDEDVPDYDGVLDRPVFLVEEATVEEAITAPITAVGAVEVGLDITNFFHEIVGAVVTTEFFGVAVPETDVTIVLDFDQEAGVVVFELGDPVEVGVEGFGLFEGDCCGGSRRINIVVFWDLHFAPIKFRIKWFWFFVARSGLLING
jgi:hypothetical protein